MEGDALLRAWTRQLGYPMHPPPRYVSYGLYRGNAGTGRVSRRTKLVVRYHDAIPVLMPAHYFPTRRDTRRVPLRALQRNVADGAWFACDSESTRQGSAVTLPEAEGEP